MATTGKKEYTLKINGIDTAVKNVTTLEAAVNSLDTALGKVNNTNVNSTSTTRERTRALSDEEKAEQKLINTIDKVVQARSDANRAQIEANIAVREAQREVTREIQIRQQAEGSIKQMGMQLTNLRNTYEGLSRAERDDLAVGGELLIQIQALDKEYKSLRESTGNFRDSVGNYEKGLSGLSKLSAGIDSVSKSSMGAAQSLLGVNSLMSLFGNESEKSAEQAQALQKVIALLSLAQQVNNNLIQTGISLKKDDAVAEQQRAAATTASTTATTASSRALSVFSKALIATGIGAIIALLGLLIANFDKVKKTIFDLVPELESLEANWDSIKAVLAGVGEAIINYILSPFKAVATFIRKTIEGDIKGAFTESWEEIKNGYNVVGNFQKGFQQQTIKNEQNAIKERAKLRAEELENLIKDNQAKLGSEWQYTDEAKKAYSDLFAAKKIMYADDAKELREVQREEWKFLNDNAKRTKDLTQQRADTELSVLRAAEDARIKLIQDSDEQARLTLESSYNRQIEDLRKRLATEKDLTVKSRAALNETITSLEKQRALDLEKLAKEQADRSLSLQQEIEDSRVALIVSNYDRQTAEMNLQYNRQIEAYKKRLNEDKTLTEVQQNIITELILNAQKARGIAISRLTSEQLAQQADQQITAVEDTLKKVENKIGEVVVRNKTGLELIDVEATRKNLAATNAALDEYIAGLKKYLDEVKKAHEATLATLQEGTPEYEAELQKYARTVEDVTQRIKNAQKDQADNTKKSAGVQVEALRDLFGKIAEYADAAAMAVTSVMDTWNMGLQVQIDDLNEQLDALNERYEEAQKQREDAVKNVENIEAQLQAATGGTAEALKSQLQDAMHARAEAEREERRLAKEKEKLEADVAKKEKQMKRNDLISKIAQGFANTALGVTQALSLVFPLNFVVAGLVGAMGLVQTGIMTKQLTKLADGGEIIGPSHANGGVPIAGTNYEVEGGEFVVNKRSYGANANLVNFINDTPRAISAADLLGVVPGDTTPVLVADAGQSSEDRIVEAINGIDFQPVVSVADINDVSDEVVTVKDLAGF